MSDDPQLLVGLAREIARQGETRLMAIAQLATAADARATTLCGIFGAASIGLGAAVLAYLGTSNPASRLVASGAVTAVMLLAASVIAAYASAPRDFWIAGGDPKELRVWAWKQTQWQSEAELLDAIAQRLSLAIERDRSLLVQESTRVVNALWVAAASVAIGLLVYFLFPSCFS